MTARTHRRQGPNQTEVMAIHKSGGNKVTDVADPAVVVFSKADKLFSNSAIADSATALVSFFLTVDGIGKSEQLRLTTSIRAPPTSQRRTID
ncbi:hypothetical protein ACLOJK_028306 [Asimina triloba]